MRSIPLIPKSATSTSSGSSRPASLRTTSTPKPSSPRNTLPMPATRTRLGLTSGLGFRVQGHDLLWREVEPVPEDAVPSQVPARVIFQRHRDVDPALVVLLYTLDERDLPGERDVHNVSSGERPEHDPAPLPDLDTVHVQAPKLGSTLLLPEEVFHANPRASGTRGWPRAGS